MYSPNPAIFPSSLYIRKAIASFRKPPFQRRWRGSAGGLFTALQSSAGSAGSSFRKGASNSESLLFKGGGADATEDC